MTTEEIAITGNESLGLRLYPPVTRTRPSAIKTLEAMYLCKAKESSTGISPPVGAGDDLRGLPTAAGANVPMAVKAIPAKMSLRLHEEPSLKSSSKETGSKFELKLIKKHQQRIYRAV
jgi:hypothetical protein